MFDPRIFFTTLWLLLTIALPAVASDSAAEVLFNAGREAMQQEDYDVACSKFIESNQLDPAAGTLLNLGHCEEKRGRLATSWRRYTEAIDMLDTDDQRRAFAEQTAAALEPRVPRLTIHLDGNAPDGTRVLRNGRAMNAELGVPLRLDPGRYAIVVEAKGFEPRAYNMKLKEAEQEVLEVSVGDRIPEKIKPAPPVQETDSSSDGRATVGYLFGGAGIVAGLAGATFGVLTYRKYQVVKEHCDLDRDVCFDSVGQDAAETGAQYETLAYALGAAGVASLSVGAYLLLSAENDEETAIATDIGTFGVLQGIRIRGTF